ncbi:MAG: NAD-dependent epimerase/dehydratase [Gemmatimonadetes bacterium]|nr:NAD-dependent epimerase/dehydratase [Gemmatimonadota bacterium]
MRVFMTGAGGYIGGVVAGRLRAAGHAVAGLARGEDAARRLTEAGVEAVRGDLGDIALVEREAGAADAVIHLAMEQSRRAVELDGAVTDAVLRAMQGSGRPFLYTSGTAVLGDTGAWPADEDRRIDPAGPVAWRAAHEAQVTDAAARGVRGMVIRPSLVYGRGGGAVVTSQVQAARRDGVARYVGDGANRWSTVHVDDLADLYLLALGRAEGGSVWNAEGGETVSMAELAAAASRTAGAGGRVEGLEPDEAKAAFGWMTRMLALNLVVTSARARAELGWSPSSPSLLEELASGSYASAGEADAEPR